VNRWHWLARAALAVLVAGLIFAACGPRSGAAAGKPLRWLINGPALATFASDPTAQRFFAGTEPFVMQRADSRVTLPTDWNAVLIRSFTNVNAIRRALDSGRIGGGVRAIMYDNEHWKFTPMAEQMDPAKAIQQAAALVHAHGLLFISAPAVDLTRVLAPGPEKRYAAYLRLGLASEAARYADVYDIQAQGSEKHVPQYSAFVRAAAAQARAANPKVIVLAGISTNPNGQRVTADDILGAINATRGFVDGYWLNVPKPSEYCPGCTEFRPDLAIDVLRRLGR
jgi:hypothetical protein